MFYLLTLPFRLFFGVLFGLLLLPFTLLFLPFLLLRFVVKAAVFLLVMPVLLLAAFVALIAVGGALLLALLVPLLPFAFVAFCIWAIVRSTQRSPVAI